MGLNVSLPDHWVEFVERRVASGQYDSAGDVLSDALSLLVARDSYSPENTEWLRRAYEEGIAGGFAENFDFAELKAKLHAEFAARSTKAAE